MYKSFTTIILIALLISGCSFTEDEADQNVTNNKANSSTNSSQLNENVLTEDTSQPEQTALIVMNLIKLKDLPRLAAYIHPTSGVRFSPYGYVNTETDMVMQASILQNALLEEDLLEWGSYQGSGKPIQLSFANYYEEFIYDHDFANVAQVNYNSSEDVSNTVNNVPEVYPDSYIAEFHFKGTAANEYMDWSSLRIVFTELNKVWVIVGIIHDQRTN